MTRSDGPRFSRFCREYVRHTKGRWAKQPLVLEEWQEEFAEELFAFDPIGRRYYTEALWLLPRKNGKSTFGGSFGLYMAGADGEEEPEVYVAAASKDQARIIYRQMTRFVAVSPALQDEFDLRVLRNHIEIGLNAGILRVVSSDAPKQHGLNPSGNVIDEIWAHEDPELYTALTSGSGAREQPLTLGISTVGWDPTSLLYQMIEKARKRDVEERPGLTVVRDREHRFLLYWHHAPEDSEPEDLDAVKLGNPASWITREYLSDELGKPSMRLSDFRRLHANLWTNTEESWLPAGVWAKCKRPELRLDPRLPLAVGVDIALTHDLAAVVLAQRQPDPDGHPEDVTVVRARFWENPFAKDDPRHADWELDLAEVREYLRELFGEYPTAAAYKPDTRVAAPGPVFLYDPWQFKESAQMLAVEGLNLVEFPQWNRYVVPAANTFYQLAVAGRLVHDGEPTLAEHVGNAAGQRTDRGWRPRKPKGPNGRELEDRHIDGVAAALPAINQAQQPAPKSKRRAGAASF